MILNLGDQLKSTAGEGSSEAVVPLLTQRCLCTDEKALGQETANQCFPGPSLAPAALAAPPSPRYFFFALTFLQTQFMPSLGGEGQREAVLAARKVPRAQAGGDCGHLL